MNPMRFAESFEDIDSYAVPDRLYRRVRNVLALIALAGVCGSAAGFLLDRRQFDFSWLVSFAWFITIATGSLFFVMLQHLTGAGWSVVTRRISENLAATLAIAAVLFLPVAFGMHGLYVWTDRGVVAHDAILQGKRAWLNEPFFLIRAAAYFAIWSLWALRLRALSVRQDAGGEIEPTRSAARWSAPGMPLAIVTVALASFDWLMSLEPHWYSTIFGVYVYAGGALASIAALALILLALRRGGVLRQAVTREHYHDLGKWIFGLTVFWAYIAFSQYLLIWYANLPEETIWFQHRLAGSWRSVGAALVIGHFLAPFFVLVSRAAKRSLGVLGFAAAWVLLMHYLDLYWIVMPVLHRDGAHPHWMDLATFLAVAGIAGLAFWFRLKESAAAPIGDPRFEQSLEFEDA